MDEMRRLGLTRIDDIPMPQDINDTEQADAARQAGLGVTQDHQISNIDMNSAAKATGAILAALKNSGS